MNTKPKDKDEIYESKKKSSDEMFCYSCGSIIKINASVCPKCGVLISGKNRLKEKSTSILIALFLSFFTWLYLYEKNVIKFWIGLSVSIIFFIITMGLYDTLNSYWYFFLIPILIIWIYALIDVAVKDKDYYNSFGG